MRQKLPTLGHKVVFDLQFKGIIQRKGNTLIKAQKMCTSERDVFNDRVCLEASADQRGGPGRTLAPPPQALGGGRKKEETEKTCK